MKIVIIGQGNVATNLQHGWTLQGLDVPMVSSRTGLDRLPPADCYVYAVADRALAEVAARVHAPKSLHVHTSGTMPLSVFGDDKPMAGVLYFFQSFSKSQLVDDWQQIPVFVEGRGIDDIAAVYALAQTLSSRIYETAQAERERLHVAGVFANNFTNLMYRHAAQILSSTTIPFSVLLPLIDQTAQKMHQMAPEDAQTGPAKRRDQEVMAHHMELIDNDQRQVYRMLSEQIMKAD